ncbi:hypothetical protein DBR06_SOUSAS1810021, partial [Sousa chinensis]
EELDKMYNPLLPCILGRSFSSYVTHKTKCFIYFHLDQEIILLFRSG